VSVKVNYFTTITKASADDFANPVAKKLVAISWLVFFTLYFFSINLVAAERLLFSAASYDPQVLLNDGQQAATVRRGLIHMKSHRVNKTSSQTNTVASIQRSPFAWLSKERDILLNLFPDRQLLARRTAFTMKRAGDWVWKGELDGMTGSLVILMVNNHRLFGNVYLPNDQRFTIRPMSTNKFLILELDQAAVDLLTPPLQMDEQATAMPLSFSEKVQPSENMTEQVVDVMFLYTAAAKSRLMGGHIHSEIELALEEANESYINSDIDFSIQAVYIGEIDYQTSGQSVTDLSRLSRHNDGIIDGVHGLRDQFKADVVVLLVNSLEAGVVGRSYQMLAAVSSFASKAFAVIDVRYLSGYYVLPHELGHIMGANHDRHNSSAGVFSYSFGYQEPQGSFRTIMAYQRGCLAPCPLIPYFSNPPLFYSGLPLGITNDLPLAADNARTLNETVTIVADYRVNAHQQRANTVHLLNDMNVAREQHVSVALADGRVLIAGGRGSTQALQSVEIFDPDSLTFAVADELNGARFAHVATLLNNGQVLLSGGNDGEQSIASVEIFDPVNDAVTLVGEMTVAREQHTATLLSNGQVLIAGGMAHGQPLDSAELYDPLSKKFLAIGSMISHRGRHIAVLLPTGNVLLQGGLGRYGDNTTSEVFQVASQFFQREDDFFTARHSHAAHLTAMGDLLFIGGSADSLEILDLAKGELSVLSAATANEATIDHSVMLNNGLALFVSFDSLDLFDLTAGAMTHSVKLSNARFDYTATLLQDGRVLLLGGRDNEGMLTTTAEIFKPFNALDNVPPVIEVMRLNDVGSHASGSELSLSFKPADIEQMAWYYMAKNDRVPSASANYWIPYHMGINDEMNIRYRLSEGTAMQNVWLWLKDGAGNISLPAQHEISYDIAAAPMTTSSLASGYYREFPLTVKLQCQPTGEACGKTYYALSEKSFITEFAVYEDDILINESLDLQFYSVSSVGDVENQRVRTFLLDNEPPKTTLSFEDSGVFRLICEDDQAGCAATYYTLDGSLPTDQSMDYRVPLLIGNDQVISYYSVDKAANAESVQSTDHIAPVTRVSLAGGIYQQSQRIGLHCTDDYGDCLATYYTLDGSEPTDQSFRYQGEFVISENTDLMFYSLNPRLNREVVQQESYMIDGVPPSTTASLAGGKYASTVSVVLSCEDQNSGCQSIYYTLGGVEPSMTSLLYADEIDIEKTTGLKYRGLDIAGNWEAINRADYVIDSTIIEANPNEDEQKIVNGKNNDTGSDNVFTDTKAHDEMPRLGAFSLFEMLILMIGIMLRKKLKNRQQWLINPTY